MTPPVASTANTGAYTDSIPGKGAGTFTYKVCVSGACSNIVTVTFEGASHARRARAVARRGRTLCSCGGLTPFGARGVGFNHSPRTVVRVTAADGSTGGTVAVGGRNGSGYAP